MSDRLSRQNKVRLFIQFKRSTIRYTTTRIKSRLSFYGNNRLMDIIIIKTGYLQ